MRQWGDQYSYDIQHDLSFELFNNGSGNYIIQADKRLDNEKFLFLVNFLKYPIGLEYEVEVEGFTTGKEKNQLKDKQLLVYLSPADKNHDNVFLTTSENENYKVDFAGRITEGGEEKVYAYPNNLSLGISETIIVYKKYELKRYTENSAKKVEKRFVIISIIIFAAYALTYLLFRTEDNFLAINYVIAFAVWGWLTWDYNILQIEKIYFSSLALGLVIFFYGLLLYNEFSNEDKSQFILMGSTMPILFITLQRPMRFTFKKIMNREPQVKNPAPSFPDFIYIFILWMSSVLIPAFYFTS